MYVFDGSRAALIVIDLLILVVAWPIATWLTAGPARPALDADSGQVLATWNTVLVVGVMVTVTTAILGLWIAANTRFRLYEPERLWPRMVRAPLGPPRRQVAVAAVCALAAFGSAAILGRMLTVLQPSSNGRLHRLGAVGFDDAHLGVASFGFWFLLVATAGIAGSRLLIGRNVLQARRRGYDLRALLIVGTGDRAVHFATHFQTHRELGYYVAGFVQPEGEAADAVDRAGGAVVTTIGDLRTYLTRHVVDEVLVVLSIPSAYAFAGHLITLCQRQGLTIRFISPLFDARLARGWWDRFDDEPILTLDP